MKFKASDIIRRALHLADIENTDFLTHWEHTQYINDAWKAIYQFLINKGDSQFVKEAILEGGYGYNEWVEYELPNDLYQIKSLQDKYSGREIPRKASTESINSNTYEIVNDKIRLYGVTTSNLLLTYYVVPEWITFPDRDISVETLNNEETILSSFKNSVLTEYNDSYFVKNLFTGETIANVTSWMTSVINERRNGFAQLGDGHILLASATNGWSRWYDFNGNLISTNAFNEYNSWVTTYCNEAVVVYSGPKTLHYTSLPNIGDFIGGNERSMFYLKDDQIIRLDNDEEQHILAEGISANDMRNMQFVDLDGNQCYFRLSDNILYFFDGADLYVLDNPLLQNSRVLLQYGPLMYTGVYTLKSVYEDTVFNFPNELYFSLLAADLAMRYAMKQNADFSGLQQLYQSMKDTFMNSLTQAGGFTRIKNVYRG